MKAGSPCGTVKVSRCHQALLPKRFNHRSVPAELPVGGIARRELELEWHPVSHIGGARDERPAPVCPDKRCQVALFARELHFLQGIDDGADRLLVLQDIRLNGFTEQQSSKGIPLHRAWHSSFLALQPNPLQLRSGSRKLPGPCLSSVGTWASSLRSTPESCRRQASRIRYIRRKVAMP